MVLIFHWDCQVGGPEQENKQTLWSFNVNRLTIPYSYAVK